MTLAARSARVNGPPPLHAVADNCNGAMRNGRETGFESNGNKVMFKKIHRTVIWKVTSQLPVELFLCLARRAKRVYRLAEIGIVFVGKWLAKSSLFLNEEYQVRWIFRFSYSRKDGKIPKC
jgi:hypothetical protein